MIANVITCVLNDILGLTNAGLLERPSIAYKHILEQAVQTSQNIVDSMTNRYCFGVFVPKCAR